MPFSAQKMHFFDKNDNLTHWTARDRVNVKELLFREVILHQFLKQKNIALNRTLENMVHNVHHLLRF